MEIEELKDFVMYRSSEKLRAALLEIYQMLAPDRRQEADKVIRQIFSGPDYDVQTWMDEMAEEKSKETAITVLVDELNLFLMDAYDGDYRHPGDLFTERERATWCVHLQSFLQQLAEIQEDDVFFTESGTYYQKVFRMLSDSYILPMFESEDALADIGITQQDLFRQTVRRVLLSQGITIVPVGELQWQAAVSPLSPGCKRSELTGILLSQLDTENAKRLAIRTAKQMMAGQQNAPSEGPSYGSSDFAHDTPAQIRDGIQELNRSILWIYALLEEMNPEQMDFYFENTTLPSPQETLSEALEVFRDNGLFQAEKILKAYAADQEFVPPEGAGED